MRRSARNSKFTVIASKDEQSMNSDVGKRKRKTSSNDDEKPSSKAPKVKTEHIKEEDPYEIDDSHSGDESGSDFEDFDSSKFGVSELEKLRQENIKKNMERFSEINVVEAKHEFSALSSGKKQKINIPIVGLYVDRAERKKKLKEEWSKQPRRQSMRIRQIASDNAALPQNFVDPAERYLSQQPYEDKSRKPEEINMESVNKTEVGLLTTYLESWSTIISNMKEEKDSNFDIDPDLKRYKESIESLNVNNVGKVTKSRIFSMAFHPMVEKTLVVAGDKWGGVGIWDVGSSDDGKNEVFLFEPHTRPINCLKFSPTDGSKLYTCSYDGTLRYGDLEKQKFYQSHGCDEDTSERYNSFAWVTNQNNSVLVASNYGEVIMVDTRSKKAEHRYALYEKSLRWIDCHPVQDHILVGASYDGTVATWDLRKLNEKRNTPLSSFRAAKTISTCFFSPITGNKLLLTSQDDYLRVFDINDKGCIITPPRWPIKHNNWTGRWLTTFRACWDPKTDNSFMCGSMNRPRQVDVYSCGEGKTISSFSIQHENFTTVSSVNAFHPSKNIICGGNSSGKVYVWT